MIYRTIVDYRTRWLSVRSDSSISADSPMQY